jgi:hypothetical protein
MAEPRSDRVSSEALVASRTYGPVAPKISDEALIEQLMTERDRYAAMLLSAEQELARRPLVESDELERYQQLCLVLVNSRSWRLTRPLRAAGTLVRALIRGHTNG